MNQNSPPIALCRTLCPHFRTPADPLFPRTRRHPSPPSLHPGVKKDYRLDLFSRFPTYLKPTYVHSPWLKEREKETGRREHGGTPQQESSSSLVLMHDGA